MEIKDLSLVSDLNILAYYRFGTGALTTDSSGKGVTLTNNNTVGEAVGYYDYCADFGAANTDKFLSYASDLGTGSQTVSMSFWFKMTNASDNVGFIELQDAGTYVLFSVFYSSGLLYSQRYRNGTTYDTISVTKTMDTNWHHCCTTLSNGGSGGPMILYLDGVNIGSTTALGGNGSVACGDNFFIGKGNSGSLFMKGYMDDVAVFNRVLTPSEVEIIASRGPAMMNDF